MTTPTLDYIANGGLYVHNLNIYSMEGALLADGRGVGVGVARGAELHTMSIQYFSVPFGILWPHQYLEQASYAKYYLYW